jgi:carbon monoxide dehydrogenase subunit G
MSGFELNEWINVLPADVFDALSDPHKAPAIMPNIKRMEQTTPGAVGLGTRFHEVRVVNGKEAETDLEVVAYQRPRVYAVATEQSGITVTYTYGLQEQDGGTQVDLRCAVTTQGVKRFLLPIVAGIMKREDGDHLRQLKAALET